MLTAILTGKVELVTGSTLQAANAAVETTFGFVGVMCLWLGMLKIAEEAGLVNILSKLVRPLARWLFPDVPPLHPGVGAAILNIVTNVLGMGSAATPLGLEAMKRFQETNERPDVATDAMCTFVLLNTAGLTLMPASIIGLRVALGSTEPTAIVAPVLAASGVATFVVLALDWLIRKTKPSNIIPLKNKHLNLTDRSSRRPSGLVPTLRPHTGNGTATRGNGGM
ncbi:MAG TPA: spore maturation protein [Clostridia bacterium]|nr:spore maturation protein [Clostridia bacterium]